MKRLQDSGVGEGEAELTIFREGGDGEVLGAEEGLLAGESVVGDDDLGVDVERGVVIDVSADVDSGGYEGVELAGVGAAVGHDDLNLHAV